MHPPKSLFLTFCLFFSFGIQAQNSAVSVPLTDVQQRQYNADTALMTQLYKRYWEFDNAGRHDSAVAVCRRLIEVGGRAMSMKPDSILYSYYGKAYGGVGWNLMMMGQLDEGLKYSQLAYDKLTAFYGPYHVRISEVLVGISFNYVARGDYEKGIKYSFKCLDVLNHVFPNDHYYFGNKYYNLGNMYFQQEKYDLALYYFNMANENKLKNRGHPFHAVDMARCHIKKKEFDKALTLIDESLSHFSGIERFWPILVNAYQLKGIALAAMGKEELARQALEQSLKISYIPSYDSGAVNDATTYLELAKIAARSGDPENAELLFQKAIRLWESNAGEGHSQALAAKIELGIFYTQQQRWQEAFETFQKVEQTLLRNGTIHRSGTQGEGELIPSPLLLQVGLLQAKNYYAQYQVTGSRDYLFQSFSRLKEAIELIDRFRQSYSWENSKQQIQQRALPLIEAGVNRALDLYALTDDAQYLDRAFSFIEKSKAIILYEERRERASMRALLPPDLQAREAELADRMAMYEKLIFDENSRGERRDTVKLFYWNAQLLQLQESKDSLDQYLPRTYTAYAKAIRKKSETGLNDLQRFLKRSGATVVEYFLGDSTLVTFAVSADRVWFDRQQVAADKIGQLTQQLRNFLGDPKSSPAEMGSISYQLYQLLLEKPLREFPAAKLILIPDQVLGYLPFQLLVKRAPKKSDSFRDLAYLFQEHSLSYEYSSTLLIDQVASSSRAPSAYLGLAPEYSDELVFKQRGVEDLYQSNLYEQIQRGGSFELMYNTQEVERIGALFEGDALVREKATEKAFKAAATKAGILHLAMHAIVNDEFPKYSHFLFGGNEADSTEDGRLYAAEIERMDLQAELAVLSACNTGIGQLHRGEGIYSLSRSFKAAGCPNLVMSLWPVDDASTKEVMVRFFSNLKAGMDKDNALQEAQRWYLTELPGAQPHPYYWAGFVLVGDHAPLGGEGSMTLWWWLVGGILLLGLGVWRRQKKQLADTDGSWRPRRGDQESGS